MDTSIAAALASMNEAGAVTPEAINAGYDVNLSSDIVAFTDSLERADANRVPEKVESSAVTEAIFAPLEYINNEASALVEYAQNATVSGNELSPSEVVMLTARSQEFMFHSQLTANVANRTADGLQQLFRQQS